MAPLTLGTTSSVTLQSSGEIERRAPAVGAKIWCLNVFYRQDHVSPQAWARAGRTCPALEKLKSVIALKKNSISTVSLTAATLHAVP